MPVIFERRVVSVTEAPESEDDSLKRLALPISNAEPGDMNVPPGDGMEYLRRVRLQASELPDVVCACMDDKEGAERKTKRERAATYVPHKNSLAAVLAAAAPSQPSVPLVVRPHAAWQRQLLEDFARSRETVSQWRKSYKGAPDVVLPDAANATAWASWWCAHAPSMRLLSAFDQPKAVSLLSSLLMTWEEQISEHIEKMARTKRLDAAEVVVGAEGAEGTMGAEGAEDSAGYSGPPPSDALCRWAFALLSRLEWPLDGSTCALVRQLYTTCYECRAQMWAQVLPHEHDPGMLLAQPLPGDVLARAARLDTLITLCGGYFEQAPREEWLSND